MNKFARYISAAGLCLMSWTGAQAQLAQAPLNAVVSNPPNVMFALSVEFPTAITPAYNYNATVTATAGPYDPTKTYLGYFDSGKCYDYTTNSGSGTTTTFTGAAGTYSLANAQSHYFVPVGAASSNTCSSHWAGNFLNWVAMSGLDEFRFAMTGGNRIVDTTTNTVLLRSWQTSQGSNFGEKKITGSSLVTGATPLSGSSSWFFNSDGLGVQMNFGTSTGSTSNSVYVGVQVCNSTIGVESNCQLYGTSINKPVGAIQNNNNTMKFGVFSYFNSTITDNAVMRAKSKFVGQYSYTTGTQVTNTANEWDPATGIYVSNPNPTDATNSSGGAVSASGVVNYINLFGMSSGISGAGYKTYDDVGKLYYETLSYLRNRSPDTGFSSGGTLANGDGFPMITTWDDPIDSYCQKNFIFLMGDAHTWCDKKLPGGSYTTTGNSVCNANLVDDKGSLGNGDTVNVTTWTNNISSGLATTLTGAGTSASFYMGGLAFWAHTNDIRPDLSKPAGKMTNVTTYIVDVQESQDLAINSQFWYAAKYGGFDTSSGLTTPSTTLLSNWSTYDTLYNGSGSTDGTSNTNNGIRPTNYLPAGNPSAMIAAVNGAFSQIAAVAGANAATSQSASSLQNAGGAYLYQSTFNTGLTSGSNPGTWYGDLQAFSVTASSTSSSGASVSSAVWSASSVLSGSTTKGNGTPLPASRIILTFNDGVATYSSDTLDSLATNPLQRQGVAFNALTDLSTAQKYALNATGGGITDNKAAARVSYLRGVRTNEQQNSTTGTFRNRHGLLGDIVDSSPAYVAAPSQISLEPGYFAYAQANLNRKPIVYVGSNDGMLHGFNADPTDSASNQGTEVMAYMPSPVFRKLSRLTDPSYSHTYYVDGSPVAFDACPGTAGCVDNTSWKTILLGGLNAGGQGIYALDITSPGTAGVNTTNGFTAPAAGSASSTVLWEFTDENGDPNLGYTFGVPVIAKMNNGRWAAIFGNGYGSTTADGAANTTGQGVLYIVFLSGPSGPNHTWISGTDFIKITAGGTTGPGTVATPGGLGGPAVIDSNGDGTVDIVYSADILGNLWKFDVSSATPSAWATAFSGSPLFTAKDASGNAQPITGGITAVPSLVGGFLVYFGTGSYINTADATSTTQQSYYGILDVNDGTTRVPSTFRTLNSTNSLQQQAYLFTNVTVGASSTQVSVLSDCLVNYPGQNLTTTNPSTTNQATNCPASIAETSSSGPAPQQLGFYLDLPNSGERIVAQSVELFGGFIVYVSLTPSATSCTGGATGLEYEVDPNTGGRTAFQIFDVNGTGNFASSMYTSGTQSLVTSVLSITGGTTINSPSNYNNSQSGSNLPNNSSSGDTAGGCGSGVYVPGWGCAGAANPQYAACVQIQGVGETIRQQCSIPKNRLYWRQMFTQ